MQGKTGGAVAVKVAKLGHDLRFDIPCVGPRTIEVCASNGIRILAVEADRTLLLDQPDMEELVRSRGITVVAVDGAGSAVSN